MSQVYKFDCGCTFPIIGYNGKQPIIKFNPDFETINLECERTWDLFKEGNTKGCFQLETQLGQTTSAKVKPNCIQELSDILSIVRPGCLESLLEDGISVTEHYIRRKHGQEEVKYLVPELEPILKKTYGLLIYQEQAIMIAVKLAGFTLGEADGLRKAIGKKDTTKMAAVKKMFLEKSKDFGILSEDKALEIFSGIEKSQRYAFNASHSVSYSATSYVSAYCKAHFPKVFFKNWLQLAAEKMDPDAEKEALICNAREMNITVCPPDIRKGNEDFKLIDGKIYFGISNIKKCGESFTVKYKQTVEAAEQELSKKIDEFTWPEFLVYVSLDVRSDGLKNMIGGGALDHFGLSRTQMLFELEQFNKFADTDKRIGQIRQIGPKPILEMVDELIKVSPATTVKKLVSIRKSLVSPPYTLKDNDHWLIGNEITVLGTNLTRHKLDDYDGNAHNTTCEELKDGGFVPSKGNAAICPCIIMEFKEHMTKTGKPMAFLAIKGKVSKLDNIVMFEEVYKKYKEILYVGNTVLIYLDKSNWNSGFIVKKAIEL